MELTRKEIAIYSLAMYKSLKARGRVAIFPVKLYAISCIQKQSWF